MKAASGDRLVPGEGEEIFRSKVDALGHSPRQEAGLVLTGDDTIRPPGASGARPAEDGGSIKREPSSDTVDAAAPIDNAHSRLHVPNDAFCSTLRQGANCGFRTGSPPENALRTLMASERTSDDVQDLLAKLREALRHHGRSQAGLARALKLAPSAVSRILSGERQLKAQEMIAISAYLSGTEIGDRHSAEVNKPFSEQIETVRQRSTGETRVIAAALQDGDLVAPARIGVQDVKRALRARLKQELAQLSEGDFARLTAERGGSDVIQWGLILNGVGAITADELTRVSVIQSIEDLLNANDQRALATLSAQMQAFAPDESVQPLQTRDKTVAGIAASFVLNCTAFSVILSLGRERGLALVHALATGFAERTAT